ncbi:S1 family peptidase [Sorangium sp. So ce1389]|uniref:S1 family peptidase n=1 Tax=Sorangium sp. So ce1389 TaxID=3133336 RepID=UPI003F6168C3
MRSLARPRAPSLLSAGLACAAWLAPGPARSAPDPELGQHHAAITAGRPSQGDGAVVALARRGGVFCTGTAVSPRAILTAAHCLERAAETEVLFGDDPEAGGTWRRTAAALAHPDYDPRTRANDIGLVFLDEAAPAQAAHAPALRARPLDEAWRGRGLRLVGFGLDGRSAGATMRKREGETSLQELDASSFTFLPSPSQTCFGDSGGPVFADVDGVEHLIGVASSGDRMCAEFGRAVRVDVYLAGFVGPALERAEGARGEVGERCLYDESCRGGLCRAAPDDGRVRYCSADCARDRDCPASMRCEGEGGAAQCTFPTPTPGAEGHACEIDGECASGLCASDGATRTCRTPCLPGPPTCGASSRCEQEEEAPGRFLCRAAPSATASGGGACALGSAPRSGAPLAVLALVIAAVGATRRSGRPDPG